MLSSQHMFDHLESAQTNIRTGITAEGWELQSPTGPRSSLLRFNHLRMHYSRLKSLHSHSPSHRQGSDDLSLLEVSSSETVEDTDCSG